MDKEIIEAYKVIIESQETTINSLMEVIKSLEKAMLAQL